MLRSRRMLTCVHQLQGHGAGTFGLAVAAQPCSREWALILLIRGILGQMCRTGPADHTQFKLIGCVGPISKLNTLTASPLMSICDPFHVRYAKISTHALGKFRPQHSPCLCRHSLLRPWKATCAHGAATKTPTTHVADTPASPLPSYSRCTSTSLQAHLRTAHRTQNPLHAAPLNPTLILRLKRRVALTEDFGMGADGKAARVDCRLPGPSGLDPLTRVQPRCRQASSVALAALLFLLRANTGRQSLTRHGASRMTPTASRRCCSTAYRQRCGSRTLLYLEATLACRSEPRRRWP
jgi:hypothetical protein